jgi:hypothetical protein
VLLFKSQRGPFSFSFVFPRNQVGILLRAGVECTVPLRSKKPQDFVDDPFSQKPPFES